MDQEILEWFKLIFKMNIFPYLYSVYKKRGWLETFSDPPKDFNRNWIGFVKEYTLKDSKKLSNKFDFMKKNELKMW